MRSQSARSTRSVHGPAAVFMLCLLLASGAPCAAPLPLGDGLLQGVISGRRRGPAEREVAAGTALTRSQQGQATGYRVHARVVRWTDGTAGRVARRQLRPSAIADDVDAQAGRAGPGPARTNLLTPPPPHHDL